MIKEGTIYRKALLALCLFLAVGATTLCLLPRAEAADCGDYEPGGVGGEWVASTDLARESNNAEACGPNALCEEWCIISCSDSIPSGELRCRPL